VKVADDLGPGLKGNPRQYYGQGSRESLRPRYETEAAPDGYRSCGNQPANISLIRRRSYAQRARRLDRPSKEPRAGNPTCPITGPRRGAGRVR